MKKLYLMLLMGLVYPVFSYAQPADLVLSSAESGTQLHQATNSITFAAGYSYTPNGGTMTAEIVEGSSDPISGNIAYSPSIDPAGYSINTSLAVGTTEGYLQSFGTANYSIPLKLPKGTTNLQPSLSLNYFSSFNDGVMGVGWNIEGLSVISRVNKTFYHDIKSE